MKRDTNICDDIDIIKNGIVIILITALIIIDEIIWDISDQSLEGIRGQLKIQWYDYKETNTKISIVMLWMGFKEVNMRFG